MMQMMRNLGPARLGAIAGITLLVFGAIIFLISKAGSTPMELLFGNLEAPESKRLVEQLEQSKIPFELKNNGQEIYVPGEQVLKLRVQMAENAIPGGASLGYRVFDDQSPLGSTDFMQKINLVRALEGELTRTVSAIEGVKSARVHLVLPERQIFSRTEQKPSASVFVRMKSGRLSKNQIQAIQNLIAGAVPKLETNMVGITDDKGNVLARIYSNSQDYLANTAEEMRRDYEERFMHRIEDLLSRTLGPGKVRAEVAVELDLDRVVTSQEVIDTENVVPLSTVTVEETNEREEREPDAVSVGTNLPDAGLNSNAARQSEAHKRTEETTNNRMGVKKIDQVRESAVIKRISAAVLIDGDYTTTGEQKTYQPRSEQDIKNITELVKGAIGFNGDREDQIHVANLRFASLDDGLGDEKEWEFMGFTKTDVMSIMQQLGIAIVAVLVILLVVRPLLTRAFETMPTQAEAQRRLLEQQQAQLTGPGLRALAPGAEAQAEFEGDELIDIDKVEGRVRASSLKKIGEIVEKHPEEALSIVRNWLYQEGP